MIQPEDDGPHSRNSQLDDQESLPDFTPVDSDADEEIQRLYERVNEIRADVQEAQKELDEYEAGKEWLTSAGTIVTAVAFVISAFGMLMSQISKPSEKSPAERRELREALDEAVRKEKEKLREALSD